MKSHKALLAIIGVVLALGLLVGCGHPKHRWHRRDFSNRFIKRLDRETKKLNLTEQQKERYTEIRAELQANLLAAREERTDLFNELHGQMDRENPDISAMADLLRARLREMPGMMEKNIDLFVEFYDVLDEDQKAQVLRHIRRRMPKK